MSCRGIPNLNICRSLNCIRSIRKCVAVLKMINDYFVSSKHDMCDGIDNTDIQLDVGDNTDNIVGQLVQ